MKELTFNEWQAHIARQLESDYIKIFNQPKNQSNERILQSLSRQKARDLRRV
jgi:hypothetical protein